MLYNGTIIDEIIGDNSARVLHYFSDFPEANMSRIFQCVSTSPGGCTAQDVQATFTNGAIIDKTIADSMFGGNNDTLSLCEDPTLTKNATTTTLPTSVSETTAMPETTSTSCENTSVLKVNIRHSTTCAALGSEATLLCEVIAAPETSSISVTWVFNETIDLLAQPVDNLMVDIQSSKQNSFSRITADVVISGVDYVHAGTYMCTAHSVCPSMHASSSIVLSVEANKLTEPPPVTTKITSSPADLLQTTQIEDVMNVSEPTDIHPTCK